MGQMTNTAWKNTCGTMAVQLQQSHPCEWQNQDSSQAKQNYHCMMTGIELERRATVHEMSNQQSEKQIFPNTNLHCLGENWSLPTTSQLHLVCTTLSLLRTILDPVAVPKLLFLCSCLCCRDLGSIANKDRLEEHLRHVASILASGKTRMAPKTNKSNVHVGWHRTRKLCQWP